MHGRCKNYALDKAGRKLVWMDAKWKDEQHKTISPRPKGQGIKIRLSDKQLLVTLFCTILNFTDLRRSILKTLWEKEKKLIKAFSPLPTMFSTLSKTNFIV